MGASLESECFQGGTCFASGETPNKALGLPISRNAWMKGTDITFGALIFV